MRHSGLYDVLVSDSGRESYRSGRWRSEYTVDVEKGEVRGKVLINVHYYEQGNVCFLLEYFGVLVLIMLVGNRFSYPLRILPQYRSLRHLRSRQLRLRTNYWPP